MKVVDLKVGQGGKGEVKLFLGKEETGTITYEYTLKDHKDDKSLVSSNIKCSFVKKT